jgi:hypothetical protein
VLIAAAVCPHPPLLIPEAAGASGAGDAELRRLRTACRQAVTAILAERPDLIAVAGADPQTGRSAEYPPWSPGSLHDYGVPFAVGEGSVGEGSVGEGSVGEGSVGEGPVGECSTGEGHRAPALPLSLTIGKWLLSEHRVPPTAWWGIAADAASAECLQLGEKLAALAPRVALLAMGDGPARRARAAPHTADPEADRYDDQVAGALATADAEALAALDPGCDRSLEIAGRPAWQVLAGAAAQHAFDAELRYRGAPFEVSYLVASWRRRP